MRLSKNENVARGYAVINPNGDYRKPACMNAGMKNLVDSGHVRVTEWGKVELTNKWNDDINAVPQPTLEPLSTATGFDRMLEDLEISEIDNLSVKIKHAYPQSPLHWLLEEKPAELIALENKLQRMVNAYWTDERKAIKKANNEAQYNYDAAVARIETARNDAQARIDKAESFLQNAIERKNNPGLAAKQDKISAIIKDKKRSSLEKTQAILEGDEPVSAKRDIVVAIAAMLGKGLDKDSIFFAISDMPEFQVLAYKRPEREFDRLYNDTVNWIQHKNTIKVFWDLVAHVYFGINNSKIRVKTRNDFIRILVLIALHQAKDNQSRGLVAFRYFSNLDTLVTRDTVVSPKTLEPKRLSEKFSSYAKLGYITYEKGEQGGVASRAGITPYSGTLTQAQVDVARSAILQAFAGSEIDEVLTAVLSLITKDKPAYSDQNLENAVAQLLTTLIPLTRKIADARIAERHIEETPFREDLVAAFEARKKEEAEATTFVNAHLATGLGLQPRVRLQPSESHIEATGIKEGTTMTLEKQTAEYDAPPVFTPGDTAEETSKNIDDYVQAQIAYKIKHIADDIEF